MKTRVKQHIYVVVFWLMAKYLFSLYYSAAIVNQFHMSLYNSADSHGWVTHIFKVIAHMFKMLCVSLLSTLKIITRCRCKIRARRNCWRKPPKPKRNEGLADFQLQPKRQAITAEPMRRRRRRTWEHFYIAGRRRFVMKRESPFARKWRYNRKTLVCVFACDGGFTSVILAR